MNKDYLFALDIGTRTVVGLLCRMAESGQIAVEHYHLECHPQRAMLDGQIHDVGQVSAVLAKVKEGLEEKSGAVLKEAAIAAAGRALSTLRAEAELEFTVSREVTPEDVHQLEIRALGVAREEMAREKTSLYCVGFSPVQYLLNDIQIANPVGQRGKSIGIEIIATFLPQVVVDSLFSALGKAGLTVGSLTLEPIAAMNVAVPPQLRLLNLALVDIGAGTSDIAVSRDGTIISYGMVDMAGDEVTEAISQHFLLDFNSAEQVKVQLESNDSIEFTDVLGNKYSETRDSIVAVIDQVVDRLALALADAIKENNGGTAPSAVFCAGGGSLTPVLRDYLSLHLDLPLERIGIRNRETLEGISFDCAELAGPEIVTPLGIAMTALKPRGEHFIQVWINGTGISLFNVQKTTVAQALIHSGMDIDAAAGVDSGTLAFELNGSARKLTGRLGKAGAILVNGNPGSLETEIIAGDRIEFKPGQRGEEPRVTLADLVADFQQSQVKINDTILDMPLIQKINGLPAEQETKINTGDRVEIRPPANAGELATIMDLDLNQVAIEVNGTPAQPSTPLTPDSVILVRELVSEGQPGQDNNLVKVTVNGRQLSLTPNNTMLMYALAEADINYTEARGNLMITVNGKEADFTSILESGDRVEVFWAPTS